MKILQKITQQGCMWQRVQTCPLFAHNVCKAMQRNLSLIIQSQHDLKE